MESPRSSAAGCRRIRSSSVSSASSSDRASHRRPPRRISIASTGPSASVCAITCTQLPTSERWIDQRTVAREPRLASARPTIDSGDLAYVRLALTVRRIPSGPRRRTRTPAPSAGRRSARLPISSNWCSSLSRKAKMRSAGAEIDLAALTSTSNRRYLLPPVCVTSTHATNERPPRIAEQQRREHRSTVRSLSERAVSAAQNCGSAGYSTPMRAAAMPAMSSLRSLHSLWVARVKLARDDPGVELAGSARGLVRDRRR